MSRILLPLAAVLFSPTFPMQAGDAAPEAIRTLVEENCFGCHDAQSKKGKLDLTATTFNPSDSALMERWVQIFDRVEKGEMPPKANAISRDDRTALLGALGGALQAADSAAKAASGRRPMRRLNRIEFEQNLRDLLELPNLDIRDMLPADREAHHFDKVASTLDISHVQLTAYLDAVETALHQAMVTAPEPPDLKKRRGCSGGSSGLTLSSAVHRRCSLHGMAGARLSWTRMRTRTPRKKTILLLS